MMTAVAQSADHSAEFDQFDEHRSGDLRNPSLLSDDLVMLSEPTGIRAEAIRKLRTRIIAQHLERGRRTLTLSSPTAGSGCSFVAANLAVAFAQIGIKVLLIDGDMRSGGLDHYFGQPGKSEGLLQYLTTSSGVPERFVNEEVLPSLSLIPAGGQAENAQELLSNDRFEALVHNCLRQFDLTIIDTPPARRYADAHRISTVARYAAIVARAHTTYFADVSELASQLAADRVSVIGTILNEF